MPVRYAELHCLSNFTFLRGASHPRDLVTQAAALGYTALALTDECSLSGIVRAHVAAKEQGLKLIVGSELRLTCGFKLIVLATDRHGYGRLCRLITRGRRAAAKGGYCLTRTDLALLEHCLILWLPGEPPRASEARWLEERFPGKVWIAVELSRGGADCERLQTLRRISRETGLRLVASGDVHMHVRSRRRLQDALTAIRLNVPIAQAGNGLYPNGERYLRERERLGRLYPRELLEETVGIAQRCVFSLDELRYEYPRELVPPGQTPATHLRRLTEEGVRRRWPQGMPSAERAALEHELALIAELRYEPYFLTVHDIVAFARRRGILCQGRGSAANSRVCYCLGVTAVDPQRGAQLVFERFISKERNEPPDIDIDFEHERREEVIQYVYDKYGRERTAITATVIMYRPRSALRDLGKAFGLAAEQCARLTGAMQWWDGGDTLARRLREAGFDPGSPVLARLVPLAQELMAFPGFPRHLSQHVGGFVISAGRLDELVPIENAAMEGRTVVQWDKDDLDVLGLLKVDLLALGMLTTLRKAFDLIERFRGARYELGRLPAEDRQVYEMISRADTIGVFQIESRAQMAMLPRLRPKEYYDLVIEVAIVRPGPIQGDMVHPYLRRRQGREAVSYPSDAVEDVLRRTLGVPIFQEQVMRLAVVAAGFTPGEADQLRRAMGAWKRTGGLGHFRDKLLSGMTSRGYSEQFAQRIYQQMTGFADYGFPEAHAASFALLAYDSAWLKCYEPAAFTAALLNSQPMGFYAPAQLVRDARSHGVEVRPADVCESDWDCTLESRADGQAALRLGLRLVKGLAGRRVALLVEARRRRAFDSVQDLARRAGLDRGDLEALAAAGALASLSGNRHFAFWDVAGTERALPLETAATHATRLPLTTPTEERDARACESGGHEAGSGAAGEPGPASRGEPHAANGSARMHAPELRGAGIAQRNGQWHGEPIPLLSAPTEAENVVADYASMGLTLGRHPLALLRGPLRGARLCGTGEIVRLEHGSWVRTAGIVLTRQRPSAAKGVTFLTLEDETGQLNVIVWERVGDRYRQALVDSQLLEVHGRLQRQEGVIHLVARRLIDRSRLLGELLARSRDFR